MKKLLSLLAILLFTNNLYAANIPIDYMEYSSDANAQAAWVSNDTLASHFDGANGAVAYTDPIAGAATFVGTAQLSTAQKYFGTASLLLDGDSDYVTYPDSGSWDFGTGDFTIDCWVWLAALPTLTAHSLVSNYQGSNGFSFQVSDDGPNHSLMLFSNGGVLANPVWEPSLDTWYHVAVTRSGTNLRLFVNGFQIGSTVTNSTNITGSTETLKIGALISGAQFLNGYIDEVRISKGVARWTSNFTPPISPYPNNFLAYSESTIKTQGSYSLKAVAAATDSLNKTLTKTFSPTINLSDQTLIKFDMRTSRTGSNIKIGFHDSGGTTTEVTPNQASADTYQTNTVDISAVSNANKDGIDSVIITVTNADSDNTIYIDNLFDSVYNDIFGMVD